MSTPCRVVVNILFYRCPRWRPHPRQRHTNYQGNPCSNFFLEACFLFPRALAFDFYYDLDLCSQGQAVRAFFIGMGFSLIFFKRGILIKRVRKLYRQVAHDLIMSKRWLRLWSSSIGRLQTVLRVGGLSSGGSFTSFKFTDLCPQADSLQKTGPLVAAGGVVSLLACLARVICLPLSFVTLLATSGNLVALTPHSFF